MSISGSSRCLLIVVQNLHGSLFRFQLEISGGRASTLCLLMLTDNINFCHGLWALLRTARFHIMRLTSGSVSTLRCLARCSNTSVLHHNRAVWRVLTPQKFECSAFRQLYLKRPCSRPRDLQRLSPLLKETRLPLLLSRTTVSDCSFHNTESFFSTSTDAVWAWCPGHR